MLAFDLNENGNADLRRILAKHGWFQTVIGDLPHFTFLGASENELPNLGLRKITSEGREFWLPQRISNDN
ncbi:MAG: hypothetical protein H7Z37_04680 [Pyrinomonadaceae bacterium]|nr:hypothetical protein [Pyrinomonadaceae bacterium]